MKRENSIRVYLTDAEKELIRQAAELDGENMNTYARRILIRAARQTLKGERHD